MASKNDNIKNNKLNPKDWSKPDSIAQKELNKQNNFSSQNIESVKKANHDKKQLEKIKKQQKKEKRIDKRLRWIEEKKIEYTNRMNSLIMQEIRQQEMQDNDAMLMMEAAERDQKTLAMINNFYDPLISDLEDKIDKTLQEIERLNRRVAENSEALASITLEIEQENKQLESMRLERDALTQKRAPLVEKQNALTKQLIALETKIDIADPAQLNEKLENIKLAYNIENIDNIADIESEIFAILDAQTAILIEKSELIDVKVDELSEQCKSLELLYENSIDDNEKEQYLSQLKVLEQAHQDAQAQAVISKLAVQEATATQAQEQQNIAQLITDLKQTQQFDLDIAKINQTLATVNQQLETMDEKIIQLNTNIPDKGQKIQKLMEKQLLLQQEIAQDKEKIRVSERRLSEMQNDLSALREAKSDSLNNHAVATIHKTEKEATPLALSQFQLAKSRSNSAHQKQKKETKESTISHNQKSQSSPSSKRSK